MTAISGSIYPDVEISKRMKKNLHEGQGPARTLHSAAAHKLEAQGEEGDRLKLGKSGDIVNISEEGRALQQQLAGNKDAGSTGNENSTVLGSMLGAGGGEAPESVDPKEWIQEQIRDVKKKLEQAQKRLEQAKSKASVAHDNSADSPEDSSEAAAEAIASVLGGAGANPEVEAIQSEIDMLNQQLHILNQQLVEASKSGGAGAVMGTAGIGGVATGPSGQGERIQVRA